MNYCIIQKNIELLHRNSETCMALFRSTKIKSKSLFKEHNFSGNSKNLADSILALIAKIYSETNSEKELQKSEKKVKKRRREDAHASAQKK